MLLTVLTILFLAQAFWTAWAFIATSHRFFVRWGLFLLNFSAYVALGVLITEVAH